MAFACPPKGNAPRLNHYGDHEDLGSSILRAECQHFVVSRDGYVIQMVPLEKRAWHAGASHLDGVSDVNSFSIGMKMVNTNDGRDPYTDLQYESVTQIIEQLRKF